MKKKGKQNEGKKEIRMIISGYMCLIKSKLCTTAFRLIS
jgi:hypothetical protein